MHTSSFNAISAGSAALTVREGLEAHLAAVLAVAGHGAGAHLHHVHHAGPQPLQPRRVRLAARHGRVVLVVVLREPPESHGQWDGDRGQREDGGTAAHPVEGRDGVRLQGDKGEALVLLQERP